MRWLDLFRFPPERRKAIWGWVMYDWANSAFATTVMVAVLPVYYHAIAAPVLGDTRTTAYWGYTASTALLIVALLTPVLGAIADQKGRKKHFLTAFALLGMFGTALLYFVYTGDWLKASIFYIIGNVGFAAANVFYDALLPTSRARMRSILFPRWATRWATSAAGFCSQSIWP